MREQRMKKTGENKVQVPGYKTTATFIFFMMTWLFIIQSSYATVLQDCMMEAMENANDNMTIGELRQHCEQLINVDQSIVAPEKDKDVKLVEERMRQDRQNVLLPFTLMAHKPSYVIIAGYNASSYNSEQYEKQYDLDSIDIDDVEAKFQLSIKFPLLVNLFNDTMDIYAAYTNRSFWQVLIPIYPLRSEKPTMNLKHGFNFIRDGNFSDLPTPGTPLVSTTSPMAKEVIFPGVGTGSLPG